MNIAIIGRTEILYETAQLFLKEGFTISLIVTSKAAKEYTKNENDFEQLAKKIDAKFILSPNINESKYIEEIKKCGNIDIAISMNYVSILSNDVINLFTHGILNAHGGDLPRYRGNACQAWAIINKESKIGLCIHKMQGDSLDSGDIIVRRYLNIDLNTKVTQCWEWMNENTPSMFLDAVFKLSNDKGYYLEKQSTLSEDSLRCYPRKPEDGIIDWKDSRENILRLINASTHPYSGAYCFYKGTKLIVWDAELYDDGENYLAIEGQVSRIFEDFIIVITGDGKIKINKIEFENIVYDKPSLLINSYRDRLE